MFYGILTEEYNVPQETFEMELENFNKLVDSLNCLNENGVLLEISAEGIINAIKNIWNKFINFWKNLFKSIVGAIAIWTGKITKKFANRLRARAGIAKHEKQLIKKDIPVYKFGYNDKKYPHMEDLHLFSSNPQELSKYSVTDLDQKNKEANGKLFKEIDRICKLKAKEYMIKSTCDGNYVQEQIDDFINIMNDNEKELTLFREEYMEKANQYIEDLTRKIDNARIDSESDDHNTQAGLIKAYKIDINNLTKFANAYNKIYKKLLKINAYNIRIFIPRMVFKGYTPSDLDDFLPKDSDIDDAVDQFLMYYGSEKQAKDASERYNSPDYDDDFDFDDDED